ncbi:MAG: DUF4040 domain-containing protein [Synechococcales bacterium]|nr:DUF4040 domain-containing protein [Synechococcales bacterium]
MTEDWYVEAIALLLPLTACMLVTQVNPYHALVIRGILGAVAALVYALFGAADVALTEALVGTMLSITLYAVAVRSSLSMRVGVLEADAPEVPLMKDSETEAIAPPSQAPPIPEDLLTALHQALSKYHMRLEFVPYPSPQALQAALIAKDIHTTCLAREQFEPQAYSPIASDQSPPYYLQTRIQRLYDLLQAGLPPTLASLAYIRKE